MAWVAVVRRGAMLFAIGVALNWCLRPELDWGQLRWTGVLQRIAIVYLACAAIISIGRGALIPLGLALAVIATHTFVLLATVAGSNVASLAPGPGISGLLDRQFIPGLILLGRWDPEGVLSTMHPLSSAFFGLTRADLRR